MGARLVPGRSHWVDETTLEVRLRKGLRYQDGEEFSAESFRRAFEEVQRVILEANRDYWNTERGPRLERVPQRPVTGRGPGAGLHRSRGGRHRLRGLPRRRPDPARRGGLRRPRPPARRADPHYAAGVPLGQRPYGHDPDQACDLLASAGWPSGRELRLAAPAALEAAARRLSEDFTASLGVEVDLTLVPDDQILAAQHALVEKVLPPPLRHAGVRLAGPVLRRPSGLHAQPVLPQHRRLPCRTAHPAVRRPAGPVRHRHRPDTLAALTTDLDRLAYDQALGVFLCAPRPCTRSTGTSASTAAQPPSSWPRQRSPPAHWSRR